MDMNVQRLTLQTRRTAIVGDLEEIEHSLAETPPKDWEDRASERQGDEVLEALGAVESDGLRRIDAALQRIEDGSYGICPKCGETISDERLVAVPEAALCRRCARGA